MGKEKIRIKEEEFKGWLPIPEEYNKWFEESRENIKQKRNRALEQQRLRAKKEKRNEIILVSIVVIGFIISLGLAMRLGKESMNDCMNAGHTQQYCERGL